MEERALRETAIVRHSCLSGLVIFFFVGCGNHSKPGPQLDSGSSVVIDMAKSAPADLTPGPPLQQHYTLRGFVNIIDQGSATTNVAAKFWNFPAGACSVTNYGPCLFTSCIANTVTPPEIEAGTITFGGGAQPESLSFNGAMYTLTPPLGGMLVWAVGATATIDAAGGAVAAFKQTVTVPEALTGLTAPTLGPTLARNQDLQLTWSGGSALVLFEVGVAAVGPALQCSFPAVAQAATVPKEALTAMPPGTYPIEIFSADVKTVLIGDGFVHVSSGNVFRNMMTMLQ
jgi:hypothetical protein